MENVGQLAGKVVISWEGHDYALRQADIETWGTLQNLLLDEKRARMIRAVLALKGSIPDQELQSLKKDAINESGNVQSLSKRDMQELMSSDDGFAILLWVLFEQTYPGKFNRETTRKMIRLGAVTEEIGIAIGNQIEQALGVGERGNSDGQNGQSNE